MSVCPTVFSKAFVTVRHYSLMNKLAILEIPDNIYNWINAVSYTHLTLPTNREV